MVNSSMLFILDDLMFYHNTHFFFFFNDTATTEIYTLSLHDALPICFVERGAGDQQVRVLGSGLGQHLGDRKSTRLNSSHSQISYAVFCLKKKKMAISGRKYR